MGRVSPTWFPSSDEESGDGKTRSVPRILAVGVVAAALLVAQAQRSR